MRFIKLVHSPDLLERVFGGGTPKNILVAEMIGDERVLQPGPLGDDADAGSVKAFSRTPSRRRSGWRAAY